MGNDIEKYLHNPSYILQDDKIDPTKKILLSYILSLSKTDKGCYASNEKFGELLGINAEGASKQISKLKKLGYIETNRFFKNSKEYRYIKVLIVAKDKSIEKSNIFINIPYSVLFDPNLTCTQKLLLSEITSLLKLPEGCYKSNNDFGKLIGISGSGISKQIKKLVDMNYITTKEIKIGNVTHHRKIELGTSYTTREVLPKSLGGTSQTTIGVLPKSQEGTSCRNTIITVSSSFDVFPVLAHYTSTEKNQEKNELEILEQKIIDSCSRGKDLLEHIKIKPVENIWNFITNKEELEIALRLIHDYSITKKKLEKINPSTKT